MPNIFNADNGAISGSAGIKLSSDTSGVLNIQTNGTTAISISASQVVSFPATSGFSFAGQVTFAAGTAAAPSISVTGDTNTGIYFPGADQVAVSAGGVQRLLVDSVGTTLSTGVLTVPAGTVSAPSITTTGDSNTGIYFPAADTIAFTEGGVESMRIDSSGNLGIGTASPGAKLEVAGAAKLTGTNLAIVPSTTTSAAYLVNTNAGGNFFVGIDNSTGGSFGAGAYGRILYSGGAYPIAFFTNDTERMRLDSSGNLGLGVTPSAWNSGVKALDINNGASFIGTALAASMWSNSIVNTGSTFRYRNNGVAAFYDQAGGAHAWYTAPSGTAGNTISFTQAMTLTAAGEFLVGVTSIATGFSTFAQIEASGTTGGVLINSSANQIGRLMFTNGNTSGNEGLIRYDGSNSSMQFWTAATERARIHAAGGVTIGGTTANGMLNVISTQSNTNPTANFIHNASGAGQAYAYVTGASDAFHGIIFRGVPSTSTSGTDYSANPGDQMSFIEYGGDFRFYTKQPSVLNFNAQILGGNMTITGTLTQSGTPSDISLKQNVRKLNNALPKILALEGVSFEWKEGSKERDMVGLTQDYGFIAQDVEKIVPEIVGRRPNDNLASLRYNGITALLVEAIKELKAELDQLKGVQ